MVFFIIILVFTEIYKTSMSWNIIFFKICFFIYEVNAVIIASCIEILQTGKGINYWVLQPPVIQV